jgi:threonine/homoserine/homoserine lactone efflux protein
MSFYALVGDRLRLRLKDPATIRGVDRVLGVLWASLALLMAWRVWQLLEGSH